MGQCDRAVTPVVATVLLLALVIVLAATVAATAFGFSRAFDQPGPTVGQTSGEFVTQRGYDGGVVQITHLAGDAVPVAQMEIAIDATDACTAKSRLVNLPVDERQWIQSENVNGADIVSQTPSYGVFGNEPAFDPGALTDATFTAGKSIEFRIKGGACMVHSGDEIVVRLIHGRTNSVIATAELTAR